MTCDVCGGRGWVLVGGYEYEPPEREQCEECAGTGLLPENVADEIG